MLDDRSYMREPSYGQGLPASVKLIIALAVIFAWQCIDGVYLRSGWQSWLALDPTEVLHGKIWQLITFQLLHGGPLHLFFNLLAIWFFGRVVESIHGPKRMLQMFFLCGVAGGLLQVLVSFIIKGWGGSVVGASAGTMGFLAAFCLLEPNGTVLLYFVPVRARYVLYFSLGLSLFFTLVPADPGVAHPAHLGGLLTGMAILRYGYPSLGGLSRLFARSEPRRPATSSRQSSWNVEAPKVPPRGSSVGQDFISKEVDPILDKISKHGFQSLTDAEKRTLEAARNRMGRNT